MKTIEIDSESAPAFASRMQAALASRALGGFVRIEGRPDALIVHVSRLGTSEIEYRVTPVGEGFRAERTRESIAFAHRALRGEIEGKLLKLVQKLGGRVS